MNNGSSMVLSLDIGSDRTKLCAGVPVGNDRVEICAAAMVKTKGISKSVVTNSDELTECIEALVKKLEGNKKKLKRFVYVAKNKNIKVNSIYLTIGGEHILTVNSKSALRLSERPVLVSRHDVSRLMDTAKSLQRCVNREIIHLLPQEFMVDGYKRLKDPEGVCGCMLTAKLHTISCEASFMQNLINVVNNAGISVEDVIYSGLAASFSALTKQQKHAGVILLEFGAETVDALFFKEDSLQWTSVIPFGAKDITLEIAENLSVTFMQAEQLKMQYKSMPDDSMYKIIVKKKSADYNTIIPQYLTAVVDKKLFEIMFFIKKELELSGILSKADAGIVISGGMSFMDGFTAKLQEFMGVMVKFGIMRGFVSNLPAAGSNFYAAGIGAVMYAIDKNRNKPVKMSMRRRDIFRQIVGNVKDMYNDYF